MLGPDAARQRKSVSAIALILTLLFSATALTSCVRLIYAQTESVIIRADGSVSPSTAPIQRVGDLYVLTGDVGGISVERSNITLDGRGHSIQASDIGGISLQSVQNVTVKGFSIKDCSFGFSLDYCSNITISGNNITGTWNSFPFSKLPAGIFIWNADYNIITGNRLENNSYGMFVGDHSEHNVIVGNTISGSNEGVRLFDSSSNTFYHNNFDNTKNVFDSGLDHYDYLSINTWDDGREGNFWSDYNGTDADGDGIGDTPYNLELRNQDRYPLMKPWEPDTTSPSISIASPKSTTYTKNSVFLNFSTNEPVSWLGYSLDGQENVTITGNTTLTGLPSGDHNVTVYATDEFGNTGASEPIYFKVDVPFPVVPVAAASGASVTVIGIALLIYFKKRNH